MRYWLIRTVMLAGVIGSFLATFGQSRVAAQGEPMPLADMHFHALQSVSPQDALNEMDHAGVRWASSGARVRDNFWLPYVQAAADRFAPFIGMGPIALMVRNQGEGVWKLTIPAINQYLKGLEENLKSGRFRGIGEIIINNKDSNAGQPGTHYPVDAPLVRRLFELAGTYQVPLSFHAQADPDSMQEMDRLMAQDSKVTVIWCHAGSFASARQVDQFMEKYPNFYADLANREVPPRRAARVKIESIVGGDRRLAPEWKALLEARSDRFFIGTDMLDNMSEYQAKINFFREALFQLRPEAAKRIGYENAQRLLRLVP